MSFEEIEREHVALEAITGATGRDQIARVVRPASGQRHHMVERGSTLIKTRGAVHTALATVAQGGATHGLFRGHVGRHLGPN